MKQVGSDSHPGRIVAECRGDGGMVYLLGWDPKKDEWRCTCQARTACSHLMALQMVVVKG